MFILDFRFSFRGVSSLTLTVQCAVVSTLRMAQHHKRNYRVDYRALANGPQLPRKKQSLKKEKWSTSKLYPLEVLDAKLDNDIPLVIVHYIGWDSRYDEWRQLGEVVNIPQEYICSSPEATTLSYLQLGTLIKENLHIQRKTDSLVTIHMPLQKEAFESIQVLGEVNTRGWYHLHCLRDLDKLLGARWDMRIMNKNKDFAHVVSGTVMYKLLERQPLKEYDSDGNPTFRHRGFQLVFKFVRDRGCSISLQNYMP